jgi:hypothetical protein
MKTVAICVPSTKGRRGPPGGVTTTASEHGSMWQQVLQSRANTRAEEPGQGVREDVEATG